MVGTLVLYIIGIAIALVVPGAGVGYIGYRILKPWLKRRHERALGRRRAKELEDGKHCAFCLEPVQAETDCYDDHVGWYHHHCYKALTG